MINSDPAVRLRNASLILGLVNILQPVSHEVLLREFGPNKDEQLRDSLRFLIRNELVRALPDRSYRTTWRGQNSLWSPVLTKRRDIHRMWHLADLSDAYRRGEEGGAS